MLKIYLTNLAKYNAGELVGKWVELPVDAEELQAEIKEVLGNDEEYFITDYETEIDGFKVHEYSNVFKLNEIAEKLQELDETQRKVFSVLVNNGYTYEQALDKIAEGDFWTLEAENDEQIGYWLADNGFIEIPEHLTNYVDYEKLGRDFILNTSPFQEGNFYLFMN
jgi:antirestriction protein